MSVDTIRFILFLYIQNIPRLSLKSSLITEEEYPACTIMLLHVTDNALQTQNYSLNILLFAARTKKLHSAVVQGECVHGAATCHVDFPQGKNKVTCRLPLVNLACPCLHSDIFLVCGLEHGEHVCCCAVCLVCCSHLLYELAGKFWCILL